MKKLLLTMFVLILTSSVRAGEPYSIDVGTNSVVTIVPKRTIKNATSWATNFPFAQGRYCENDNKFYMAIVGGISTNLIGATGPSHNGGTGTDNNITWLRVVSKKTSVRESAFIFKTDAGAGVCFLAPGGAIPAFGAGIPLGSQYSYYQYDGQGEVKAIATNTTVTLSIQEVEAP